MILGVLPTYLVNNLGVSKVILGAIEGSSELTSYVDSIYNNLNHKTDQVYKLLSLLICSVIQNGDTKILPPLTRCKL